jgi:hypothetical protein
MSKFITGAEIERAFNEAQPTPAVFIKGGKNEYVVSYWDGDYYLSYKQFHTALWFNYLLAPDPFPTPDSVADYVNLLEEGTP